MKILVTFLVSTSWACDGQQYLSQKKLLF